MMKIIPLSILLGFASNSLAYEIEDDHIAIAQLLTNYAALNGTNFVIYPEVKGRVNVAGLELDEITQNQLIDVLTRHDFIATKKDDVVYVLTRFSVEHLGKGIGPNWGN
ncbi:MAG: hypothetical protein JKX81_14670 [Arenicella sp.]|nr:hypothetical protein [Arenicella sp.]